MESPSPDAVKQQADVILAYQRIFSTPEGQMVLKDLEHSHHYHSPTYKDGADAMYLAFREGERNVILRLKYILKKDVNKLKERAVENEQSAE